MNKHRHFEICDLEFITVFSSDDYLDQSANGCFSTLKTDPSFDDLYVNSLSGRITVGNTLSLERVQESFSFSLIIKSLFHETLEISGLTVSISLSEACVNKRREAEESTEEEAEDQLAALEEELKQNHEAELEA